MFRRSLFAVVLLASCAVAAGPPLTTVQDVLYKADGTRFNGTVSIRWSGFEAIDTSNIAPQIVTVKVIDGNLRVQLVPTTTSTPPVFYSVTYNSDGRVQFEETWAVPSSSHPLRVRDVRTVANLTSAGNVTVSTPVLQSDVVGLIADLGARPLKGPAYAAGRVALVSPLGSLESVSGSPTDCVRVDGSSGPCGGQAPSFVDADAPAGILDGSNTSFMLSALPDPASSLALYRNGLLQKIGSDFGLSGRTIAFVSGAAPEAGDTLLASYRLTPSDSVPGSSPTYLAPQLLCSGAGSGVTGTAFVSIGSCSIPTGLLIAGDRVEIRADFDHQGSTSGYSIEIRWGATTVLHRDAAASDALVSTRADAGILTSSSQLSFQSWGTALSFVAGVGSASDAFAAGITIDFQAKLTQAGETVNLRSYSVVRIP